MQVRKEQLSEHKKKRAQIEQKAAEGPDQIDSEEDGSKPKERHFKLNLDPEYWKKKFLYPFALDLAPLRLDSTN